MTPRQRITPSARAARRAQVEADMRAHAEMLDQLGRQVEAAAQHGLAKITWYPELEARRRRR